MIKTWESSANDKQVGGTHYVDMVVQPWTVMEVVLDRHEFLGYLKGCIIKYSMRQGKKYGSDDGGKLAHYIEKYKEVIGKHEDSF